MNRLLPLVIAAALGLSGCALDAQTAVPGSGTAAASAAVPLAAAKKVWHPKPGLSWQIQYDGALAATNAQVVDLDGAGTKKAQVSALHAQGKVVICYVNAGGYENWRSDRKKFPASVIGKPLGDWPGERWLDVRKLSKLMPIMTKRIAQCKAKGFDAVDPDNMDGYANAPTGFPLTSKHALAYLKALSKVAHRQGLAIGLKNALGLIGKAKPLVDFAVNEECLVYNECGAYSRFLAAGKAVFHVEYVGSIAAICAKVPAGFSTVRKHLSLDAWAEYC